MTVVERGGHVRTKVVPQVTQNNVGHFLFENIENGTIVNIPIKARFITPSFIRLPSISGDGMTV